MPAKTKTLPIAKKTQKKSNTTSVVEEKPLTPLQLIQKKTQELLSGFSFDSFTNCDVSELFIKIYGSDFICIENGKFKDLYYWNDDEKLWCSGLTAVAYARNIISKDIKNEMEKFKMEYFRINKSILDKQKTQKEISIDEYEQELNNLKKKICKWEVKLNNLGNTTFLNNCINEISDMILLKQKEKVDGKKKKKTTIMLDTNDHLIHSINFENGLFELNKLKMDEDGNFNFTECFRERQRNDYVSKTLDWEFNTNVDKKALEETRKIFEMIQPNKTQFDLQMLWLAYCLTGLTEEQKFKMNIGYSASNGKSTEAYIHSNSFKLYSTDIHRKTFNENYEKQHKQFAPLIENPIRYVFIEELDRKDKLDIEQLKRFVDGQTQSIEKMYGTTISGNFQAKLNTTSNKDPNLNIDGGILRRGILQYYTTRFELDKKEYERLKKTNKNIHLADKKILKKYKEDETYKNAYFHLLLPYVIKYYKDGLVIPDEVKNNFKDVVEEYDQLKSTLLNIYDITNDINDRVHIDDLTSLLNFKLNTKYNRNTIISEMKRIGLQYIKNKYCLDDDSKRLGVIVGLKDKVYDNNNDDSDDEHDPRDANASALANGGEPPFDPLDGKKQETTNKDYKDANKLINDIDESSNKNIKTKSMKEKEQELRKKLKETHKDMDKGTIEVMVDEGLEYHKKGLDKYEDELDKLFDEINEEE